MIPFLVVICLLFLGIALLQSDREGCNFIGFMVVSLSGLGLVLLVLLLFVSRLDSRSNILDRQSLQESLLAARQNSVISQLELAAIQQEVIKSNQRLVKDQYWNRTIWDWWIVDEVMELKPIR